MYLPNGTPTTAKSQRPFRPTWLYIKQHNKTGLKYFGKTVHDVFRYAGSGLVWTRHLRKHGKDVTTLWGQLFTDRDSISKFALNFSKENNIVESTEWANLKPEDGLDGGNMKGVNKGVVRTAAMKEHLSKINTGKKQSVEASLKRSKSLSGRILTEEHKEKLRKPKPPRSADHSAHQSAARKGKPWSAARREAQNNRAIK